MTLQSPTRVVLTAALLTVGCSGNPPANASSSSGTTGSPFTFGSGASSGGSGSTSGTVASNGASSSSSGAVASGSNLTGGNGSISGSLAFPIHAALTQVLGRTDGGAIDWRGVNLTLVTTAATCGETFGPGSLAPTTDWAALEGLAQNPFTNGTYDVSQMSDYAITVQLHHPYPDGGGQDHFATAGHITLSGLPAAPGGNFDVTLDMGAGASTLSGTFQTILCE